MQFLCKVYVKATILLKGGLNLGAEPLCTKFCQVHPPGNGHGLGRGGKLNFESTFPG